METTTLPHRYTDLEKQKLIEQWKQSGKSKVAFCKERELNYYSFNDWVRRRDRRKEKSKPSFLLVTIKKAEDSIFAQLV